MDDLTEEYIHALRWMVTDMKHRFDESAIGGGYSPELLKAMTLLRDLESGQKKIVSRLVPVGLVTLGGIVNAS